MNNATTTVKDMTVKGILNPATSGVVVNLGLQNILMLMKTYQQKGNKALLILNHKTSLKVLVKSVILVKGDINYTKFYLEDGKERVVAHSIKFFESHLQMHGFLRVHRAFMINPNYVKTYNSEQEVLTMSNGQIANISRRKRHILRDMISQN